MRSVLLIDGLSVLGTSCYNKLYTTIRWKSNQNEVHFNTLTPELAVKEVNKNSSSNNTKSNLFAKECNIVTTTTNNNYNKHESEKEEDNDRYTSANELYVSYNNEIKCQTVGVTDKNKYVTRQLYPRVRFRTITETAKRTKLLNRDTSKLLEQEEQEKQEKELEDQLDEEHQYTTPHNKNSDAEDSTFNKISCNSISNSSTNNTTALMDIETSTSLDALPPFTLKDLSTMSRIDTFFEAVHAQTEQSRYERNQLIPFPPSPDATAPEFRRIKKHTKLKILSHDEENYPTFARKDLYVELPPSPHHPWVPYCPIGPYIIHGDGAIHMTGGTGEVGFEDADKLQLTERDITSSTLQLSRSSSKLYTLQEKVELSSTPSLLPVNVPAQGQSLLKSQKYDIKTNVNVNVNVNTDHTNTNNDDSNSNSSSSSNINEKDIVDSNDNNNSSNNQPLRTYPKEFRGLQFHSILNHRLPQQNGKVLQDMTIRHSFSCTGRGIFATRNIKKDEILMIVQSTAQSLGVKGEINRLEEMCVDVLLTAYEECCNEANNNTKENILENEDSANENDVLSIHKATSQNFIYDNISNNNNSNNNNSSNDVQHHTNDGEECHNTTNSHHIKHFLHTWIFNGQPSSLLERWPAAATTRVIYAIGGYNVLHALELHPVHIARLAAVIDMNSFLVESYYAQRKGMAYFPEAGFINHSCTSNASYEIMPEHVFGESEYYLDEALANEKELEQQEREEEEHELCQEEEEQLAPGTSSDVYITQQQEMELAERTLTQKQQQQQQQEEKLLSLPYEQLEKKGNYDDNNTAKSDLINTNNVNQTHLEANANTTEREGSVNTSNNLDKNEYLPLADVITDAKHVTSIDNFVPMREKHIRLHTNATRNAMYLKELAENKVNLTTSGAPTYLFCCRASRDIAVDEEILISYVPSNWPYDARQQVLHDRYGFWCKCSKCAPYVDERTMRISRWTIGVLIAFITLQLLLMLARKVRDAENESIQDILKHNANYEARQRELRQRGINVNYFNFINNKTSESSPLESTSLTMYEKSNKNEAKSDILAAFRNDNSIIVDSNNNNDSATHTKRRLFDYIRENRVNKLFERENIRGGFPNREGDTFLFQPPRKIY